MTPRPRKKVFRDLPPNLYARRIGGVLYYQYRDPIADKFISLGTNKDEAIIDAHALNADAFATKRATRLAHAKKETGPTFADWVTRYTDIVNRERAPRPNTIRTRDNVLKRAVLHLGAVPVDQVTVLQVAEMLTALTDEGKDRMALLVRSTLMDVFRVAKSEGLVDTNPAADTRPPRATVKRERLTLDTFLAIAAVAEREEAWIENSMWLALLTGQRRESIGVMEFAHFRDGHLHVVQGKTGALVRIDGRIGLTAVGMTIADVISRCRDNVVSRWILHHSTRRRGATAGQAVHIDSISKKFALCRDRTGLTWDKNPPTYHEIRSLSARLYKADGRDPQALLGHRAAAMTAVYTDSRGAEWVTVGL